MTGQNIPMYDTIFAAKHIPDSYRSVVLFFSSLQFILHGLVGEYIGKIFLQVRGRPGYLPLEDYAVNIPSSKSYVPIDKKANNKPHRREAKTSKGRTRESKVPLESRHPP